MSWFDLFFGFFSPGNKIYRSTIEKIPGHMFARQVRVNINGKPKYLVGTGLRDYLARLASGGISITSLNEKLRKAGLEGKQYQRRQEIINIIKNAQPKQSEKNKEKEQNNNLNNI